MVSGWCGDSSIEFTSDVGLSLFSNGSFPSFGGSNFGSISFGNISLGSGSLGSGITTSDGGSIGGDSIGSGNRNEDTPLAVHVCNSQGELILISLELKLSQGFVDDEGICLGAEFANLAISNVETDDVGAWGGINNPLLNKLLGILTGCVNDIIHLL